jgi:hypothetical protein
MLHTPRISQFRSRNHIICSKKEIKSSRGWFYPNTKLATPGKRMMTTELLNGILQQKQKLY